MPETELQTIFETVLNEHYPGKTYPVRVVYGRFRTMRHTISLHQGTIEVRLSRLLEAAPKEIFEALAGILLAKLFRRPVPEADRRAYRTFIQHIQADLPPRLPKPVDGRYQAQGKYFNLTDIFDRLNTTYFEGRLKQPHLGWSLKKAYTRLGFYDRERDLLVISRIFDARKTEPDVIDFLMYHEMLHILIPVRHNGGRRQVHPPQFKQLERSFPNYEKIEKWIRRKRFRL